MNGLRLTAILAALAVAGCGGGEQTSTKTTTKPTANNPAVAPGGGAPGSTPTAAPGSAQPVTGKTWDVKMLGDANGYRYDPATITIKRGDGVRWTVVSGLPHNVTFWPDSLPAGASNILQANMPQTTAPFTGPMLLSAGQTYTVSFAGVPAGTYPYYCTPHVALGMKGGIVVR